MDTRRSIEELIYRSCLVLDDKDFKGYLNLCDSGFRYTIRTHSPEIRKDMDGVTSRDQLTELKKRSDYLCTLAEAPSGKRNSARRSPSPPIAGSALPSAVPIL